MPQANMGEGCTIGQNVFIANNVRIGKGAKIQNNVSVFEGVELEDGVFLGPSMVFTNVDAPPLLLNVRTISAQRWAEV